MTREDACRSIYREAFCDPDTEFEDLLFKYCYKYCKTLEINNKTVSMLFALPCDIDGTNATYIYAVATLKSERGKGYMKQLINEVKQKFDLCFLRPANNSLIEYYKNLEFNEIKTDNENFSVPKVVPKYEYGELLDKFELHSEEDCILMYYSNNKLNIESLKFTGSME